MDELDKPKDPGKYADAFLDMNIRAERRAEYDRSGDVLRAFVYPIFRWIVITIFLWAVFDVLTSPVDLFLYVVPLATLDMTICVFRAYR